MVKAARKAKNHSPSYKDLSDIANKIKDRLSHIRHYLSCNIYIHCHTGSTS